MNNRRPNDIRDLLIFILVCASIPVIIIYLGSQSHTLKEFQPFLDQYILDHGVPGSGTSQNYVLPEPVKLIVVAKTRGQNDTGEMEDAYVVSDMSKDFKKNYQANTPEEINFIVLVESRTERKFHYTDGYNGYVIILDASLVDVKTNATIGTKTFIGGDPPGSKVLPSDRYGSSPSSEIHRWVEEWLSSPSTTSATGYSSTAISPDPGGGVCWTLNLSGFSGNRSQAWESVIPPEVKALLTYDQFLNEVVNTNPQLKADGYVFSDQKTYLMPELCLRKLMHN